MLINKVALLKDVCSLQNFINIESVSDINTVIDSYYLTNFAIEI